jgi:AraC-like DNA-binding protein
MIILTQLLFIVLSVIFNLPTEFNALLRIVFALTLLLIILYRPNFINKNGSKISFGFLFSKEQQNADINEVDFNFHFFTSFYYKNKAADIGDFANIMGVSKEVMFKYIYFKYSLSFDELVNKSRVEYFVEIVKLPKFKDYTIEALALEVGFASRQRFYQPFKKYHGGNPSDLIDVITS